MKFMYNILIIYCSRYITLYPLAYIYDKLLLQEMLYKIWNFFDKK